MKKLILSLIVVSANAFSWVELDDKGQVLVQDYIAICTGVTENDSPIVQSNPLIEDIHEAFELYYTQNLRYDSSKTEHYEALRNRSKDFNKGELIDVMKYCESKYHSNNYIKARKDADKVEIENNIGY